MNRVRSASLVIRDPHLPGEASRLQSAGTDAQQIKRASTSSWLTRMIRLLVLLSAVLLGLGLVAPCMRIETSFGRYDGWLRLLAPDLIREGRSTYSLLGGIIAMIEHGDVWLGILLLAFSCALPTVKLAFMAWANETLARRRPAGPLLRLAHHTGKFSMLDVMVLAMLVIAIKGLPGNTELRLEWGVWVFALSVVLGLIASILLGRIERRAAMSGRT